MIGFSFVKNEPVIRIDTASNFADDAYNYLMSNRELSVILGDKELIVSVLNNNEYSFTVGTRDQKGREKWSNIGVVEKEGLHGSLASIWLSMTYRDRQKER